MNPNHDELIQLNERLDRMLSSDKALEAAAKSQSSLFRAAAELTSAEHPQVSDAMRERMRAKMLQAVPEPKAAPIVKPVLRPNFAGWAAKVAAVILVLLFVGLATPPALASSLPGDALYPAKRGLEAVELAFAGDALGQVNVHFSHSERRIDESERLLAKGRYDTGVMEDALSSLETAIRIANDNNLFEQNRNLESRSTAILGSFQQSLTSAAAADLVSDTEIARLELSESSVMAFLPSQMAEPSNSSEVTATESSPSATPEPSATATQTVEVAPTEEAPDLTEEAPLSEDEVIVYVNAEGNVNVREGAGTAYPVIARLNPASEITAIGTAGDWTQVRLEDGREGWIASFLLSATEPVIVTEPISESTDNLTGGTDPNEGSSSGTSNPNNGDCERGRSCEAPGHTNGQGTNGNANGGRGNKRQP